MTAGANPKDGARGGVGDAGEPRGPTPCADGWGGVPLLDAPEGRRSQEGVPAGGVVDRGQHDGRARRPALREGR